MKRPGHALLCGFAVLFTVGLSTLTIRQAFGDLEDCISCNICTAGPTAVWNINPASVNAALNGSFEYDKTISWWFPDEQFGLSISMVEVESENIGSLDISPDYLSLGCACSCGQWDINFEGFLECDNEDGLLEVKAQFLIPALAENDTVEIVHHPSAMDCDEG